MKMNKCALYIPRPGATSQMIQHGYVDALKHLGWKVFVGNPETKLCCGGWIKEHGIRLIMTSSRYGIRQLPIDIINEHRVVVLVDALPLNSTEAYIDGPYEFAHEDEPEVISEIDNSVVHTRLEPHMWSEYMSGWKRNDLNVIHLPLAGNIIKAMPPSCSVLTDVAMVANFSHRQNIMKHLIDPLFKRIDLLGYSYQAFGDNIWQLAGLNYNGPLIGDVRKLAHVYATAKVCPNVHTERQVSLQAYVNERSFMIPLCGGLQVSDNPVVSKYLGQHCEVASSTTDFINKVTGIIEDQSGRFDKISASVEHVSQNHTYFNRLVELFNAAGLSELSEKTKIEGQRVATKHCWGMDARLSAEERGVRYEHEVISTA